MSAASEVPEAPASSSSSSAGPPPGTPPGSQVHLAPWERKYRRLDPPTAEQIASVRVSADDNDRMAVLLPPLPPLPLLLDWFLSSGLLPC